MAFQNQPLGRSEIRLLKPRRPLPENPDLITFEIIHVPLSSKSVYLALSYSWNPPGDPPGNTHSIILHKKTFPIRKNLHDALRQIQISNYGESLLWVDAICINQGVDIDAKNERSAQLRLMRQIYERATTVLVWLGKPQSYHSNYLASELMVEAANKFRKVLVKGRPYRPWWWPHKARTTGQDTADFLLSVSPADDTKLFDGPESATYSAWLGMVSLWQSSWWTRTWVFQESTVPEQYVRMFAAGFAKPTNFVSKVRFIHGDRQTSWSALLAIDLLADAVCSSSVPGSEFLRDARTSYQRLKKFHDRRVQNDLRSFLDILQMFRLTECLDPRDKVYAPLCLADSDVANYIQPDYANKNVLDVYMDVVRYSLTRVGHELDFLGHALYQEGGQIVRTPGPQSVQSTFSVMASKLFAHPWYRAYPKVHKPPNKRS